MLSSCSQCLKGDLFCVRKEAAGKCTIIGEASYNSFDGRAFHFESSATFNLMETSGSEKTVTVLSKTLRSEDNQITRLITILVTGKNQTGHQSFK